MAIRGMIGAAAALAVALCGVACERAWGGWAGGPEPCGQSFVVPPQGFSGSDLSLSGSAAVVNGSLVLTPALEGQAGSAFSRVTRASLASGFDTTFTFRLNGTSDGIAFVLQSESDTSLGNSGSGLGYASITRAFVIEIDTFCFSDERACDHVSVQTGGLSEVNSEDFASIGSFVLPIDVNDGAPYSLRVVYHQNILSIFFNGAAEPMLTLGVSLSDIMGGNLGDPEGCMYVGFTGGTGGAFAEQLVESWSFSSAPTTAAIACDAAFGGTLAQNRYAFSYVGSASHTGTALQLTDAVSGQSGAAWYRLGKGNVLNGFECSFMFQLDGAADGIAFVIQDVGLEVIGGGGSGLGYASNGPPGIARSLAVEIDTFSFGPPFEIAADHISVQTNGVNENRYEDSFSLGSAAVPVDLNDGVPRTLRIVYVPGLLEVFFNGSSTPIISAAVTLSDIDGETILDPNGCAFVGFTGSTGAVAATQQILQWTFFGTNLACTPAEITAVFDNGPVTAPGPLYITASATGTGPLTFIWRRNGEVFNSGGNVSGTGTGVLVIDPVNASWSGQYDVTVINACGSSSSGTFVDVVPPCPGDANGDSAVTFLDITTVLVNFGTSYGNGTGTGDVNASGSVNFLDITTVLVNFGSTCS